MSDTPNENLAAQEQTPSQIDADIRAKLIADGVEESDITPELIEERRVIDGKLDDTAMISGETLAAYRRRLLKAAEEAASITPEGAIEVAKNAATQAAGEAVESAKDAASNAVGNIDDKLVDFTSDKIGGYFKDIPGAGSIQEIIKKVLTTLFGGLGIGSFFSGFVNKILGRDENTDSQTGEGEDAVTDEPNGDSPVVEDSDPKVIEDGEIEDDVVEQEGAPEVVSLEAKKFAYYKSGAMLIVRLNGVPKNHNAGANDILEGLAKVPYEDLSTLSTEQKREILGAEVSDGEAGLRDEILESILSNHSETLLRIGFSLSSLQNIIKPNGVMNARLFKYFGDTELAGEKRLNEILQDGFDWKKLTFSEISMLYISSIPALRIPAINGVSGAFDDVRGFFSDGETLSDEEIDDSLHIIPRHILQGFLTGMGDDITKSTYLNSSNEDIIKLVFGEGIEVSPQDRDIMNQIFEVKSYLMGDFVNNTKLNLSNEQKQLFHDNLDYSSVLSIYAILGGIPNVDSINTISLPILLYAVSKVIGSGNGNESYQGSLYIGNYVRETLLSGTSNGLSEDELEVMEIYGRSILDLAVLSHLEGFYKTIGLGSGVTGLSMTELGAGTFAGGFVIKQLGDMQIRRGLAKGNLPLLGSFFRKIGYVGMIGGALTGGAGLLLENSVSGAFGRDVEQALAENDLDKVRSVLQQHTDSIQEHTSPNGEKYIISAYPGEVPYMVYKGDVFMLNVGGRDVLESGQDILDNFSWEAIKELTLRNVPFGQFNGVVDNIDYSKQSVEGEFILLGEGENTARIKITDLLGILNLGNPDIIGESFLNSESIQFGTEGQQGYPVQVLSENYILYFQNVGSVGDVFTSQDS